MRAIIKTNIFVLTALILAPSSFAQETKTANEKPSELREAITCFPAKYIIKFLRKSEQKNARKFSGCEEDDNNNAAEE